MERGLRLVAFGRGSAHASFVEVLEAAPELAGTRCPS
jgi:hypothetical protein